MLGATVLEVIVLGLVVDAEAGADVLVELVSGVLTDAWLAELL